MPDIEIAGVIYPDVPAVDFMSTGGEPVTYTYGGVATNLTPMALRPDAEVVKTWSHDALAHADDGITIPSYSTTAKTVSTGAEISGTYTVTYADYNYWFVERMLTTPVYSSSSGAKGKPIYTATVALYEVTEIPGNTMGTASLKYSSRSVTVTASGTQYRMPYYTGASAVGMATSSSYGMFQTPLAPSLSSGVLTAKSPNLTMRGSTTYFTSSVWGTLTDIRLQYVIELYRAPKNNLNVNGWAGFQTLSKIIECAQGTGKLT